MMLGLWVAAFLFVLSSEPEFRSPAEYPELPATFLPELVARSCRIPQSFALKTRHNVVSGSFAKKGQRDWAVLCSIEGKSKILVHWGGRSSCQGDLPATSDDAYSQDVGGGRVAYSRAIKTASPKQIIRQAGEYGAPIPFKIDHDGIEDAFLEKGSVVWYCHQGSWQKLQGAD